MLATAFGSAVCGAAALLSAAGLAGTEGTDEEVEGADAVGGVVAGAGVGIDGVGVGAVASDVTPARSQGLGGEGMAMSSTRRGNGDKLRRKRRQLGSDERRVRIPTRYGN